METILVTGAAGFIGSHTVDRLLADGFTVVGVDNFRTGRKENLEKAGKSDRFRLEEADCTDAERMKALVASARPLAVIHLAALVSVQESMENPDLNFRLNLHAVHVMAEAARLAGVKRFVFASSAAIYGEHTNMPIRESVRKRPISPYGAAKYAAEGLLLGFGRSFDMTVVCQRYFNVFGPRQDPSSPYSGVISIFDRLFREGKPVTIFGTGRQTRDFVSVHDVARANLLAATGKVRASCSHNICTGKPASLHDLVKQFGRHYPGYPAPRFEAARPGDIEQSIGSPETAKQTINFWAEIDLAGGLRELVQGKPLDIGSPLDPRPGFLER